MSWVRYLWFPRVNGVGLLSPPSSVLNLHFLTHVFQAIKFETDILSLNAHILRQWPLLSGGSFFNLIYCPIVDLQCCISFCCMQSELFIHRHISTLFQILFPYRLLQSIEQSSLCNTAGPYQLSILCVCVCVCAQLCLTLCIPMDCSPPGSSVREIFHARLLEQVAVFFSKKSP